MICEEFRNLLDNYEILSDAERDKMEKHAAECESCRSELDFFRTIINISGTIPMPKPPESFVDDVNKKIDEQSKRKPIFVKFRENVGVLSTVAACLAVGLTVGINNGYIKDHISDGNKPDGVIRETVVKTDETEQPEATEQAEAKETAPAKKEIEVATETEKPSTPTQSATSAPQKTEKPVATPSAKSEKPTATPKNEYKIENEYKKSEVTPEPEYKAPEVTPEPEPAETADVDDYTISDDETHIAYGYYNVENVARSSNMFSDYIHVGSEDMGAVVSTMSEMGFKKSGGYYMTSRENFYEFINVLSDKGVDYECDLSYNSGDEIAFRLTYN